MLQAGVLAMPFWPFQFTNVTSAVTWAAGLLGSGYYGVKLLM